MEQNYDVLIIGAGPAGSFCAYKLSKSGLKVLLIDSSEEVKRKVCGEYLCPSAVRLLKEEGLADWLLKEFLPVKGMKIVIPGDSPINSLFPENGGISNGVAVNRKKLDTNLLDLARSAGVEIRFGVRAVQVKKNDMGWLLKTEKGETLKSRILVGADGRNSFLARTLGLKEKIDTRRVALQCHIVNPVRNKRIGEMHIFNDGSYIGVDPTDEREVNISLVCNSETLRSGRTVHEIFNSYLISSPELSKICKEIPISVRINSVTPITNKMEKFTGRNFALIGDAAGFLDPLTGEGMFNALWMAKTLSEEIANAPGVTLFNFQAGIDSYAKKKKYFFRHKAFLNRVFQEIIRKPWMMTLIAAFLRRKQQRANIFVGIIGNNYRPIEGLFRLFSV